ncbi:Complement C1q-like protein 4, partial [Acipenser ruthenus]
IKFNQVLLNIGSAYNNETGRFTCPYSGVYQFFFSVNSGQGNTTDLWLMVDGNKMILNHVDLQNYTTGNLSFIMMKLSKGNVVWVMQENGSSWSDDSSRTITFGGMLIVET